MPEEKLVLVNEEDMQIGWGYKLDVHKSGLLHRAVSVFIFDDAGRLLLQQRALSKYHSGSLWSSTCCGHPRQDEEVEVAAQRRLREEMGIDVKLVKFSEIIYCIDVGNGLTEHEYDHLFVGLHSGYDVSPDPTEVSHWRWIALDELSNALTETPGQFAPWFRRIFQLYHTQISEAFTKAILRSSESRGSEI